MVGDGQPPGTLVLRPKEHVRISRQLRRERPSRFEQARIRALAGRSGAMGYSLGHPQPEAGMENLLFAKKLKYAHRRIWYGHGPDVTVAGALRPPLHGTWVSHPADMDLY